MLTGGAALWSRFGRKGAATVLPSFLSLLSRSVGLSSIENRKRISEHASLSLYPPLQDVEPFNWDAVGEAAERGYRYALPLIAAWQATVTPPGA